MTEQQWQATDAGESGIERDPEAERIVTEIEITRVDMGATIDEIGHRLQPQTIADEARDKIREATVGRVERMVDDAGQTAQRTSTTLMDTVRQNPVPAALAGLGLGWLALRMRSSSGSSSNGNGNGNSYRSYGSYGNGDQYARRSGYTSGYGSSYGQSGGGAMSTARDAASGAVGTAQDVADQAMGRVQDVGSGVQRAALDAADTVQQKAQQAQWQAGYAIQDAQWQIDRTMSENPLALGALALGVGAAVALALPSTQKEQELLGEQRDKLVEQAASAVTDVMDQAQTKVQETTEQLTSNSGG